MQHTTIIIMGVTGDLATKNLIPALYEIFSEQKNTDFTVIGVAHNGPSVHELSQRAGPHSTLFNQKLWDAYMQRVQLLDIDLTSAPEYAKLAELVTCTEGGKNSRRIIYCACPPQLFYTVATNCVKHAVIERGAEHTIVFEKPFGTSAQTAQQLNDALTQLLHEDQIMRADHYLAKELVETIAYLRFTNQVFEPLWNSNHIEHVVIHLKEQVTATARAQLYDTLGVVRDVIQSHALQLLALIAMEAPRTLEGDDLHAEKMKILRNTKVTQALFGQYRGYTEHPGINQHSTTPTYAQITCTIDTPRWQHVPFIIQAGKGLDRLCTEIKIVFKEPMCKLSTGCPVLSNELIIQIAPQGIFELSVNIKSSYTKAMQDTAHPAIMPITLSFCYSCVWLYTPQAYRVIFEQLMDGKHSLSVPFTEIEQAWRIVDPIIHERYPDIPVYEVGTAGPLQKAEQPKKGVS